MATEKRLIDAVALKRHMIKAMELANLPTITEDDLVYAIDHSDTVDAVEVVHSEWITDEKGVTYCGRCKIIDDYASVHNYCPNCGAKMDGDGNG